MAYEQKDMTGVLFKNDRKRDGRNDPDFQGSATVNGESFWLSAWVKEGKNGEFFSLALKPKDEPSQHEVKAAVEVAAKLPPVAPASDDDELPF